MSSATFNQRIFTPIPPEKGSFPLDHNGICKKSMIKYMNCLKSNNFNNTECRKEAKDYLSCRMDHELMAKESWSNLGMKEYDDDNNKEEQTVKTSS